MTTEHQNLKPDGTVEVHAGGVRVSMPAALLASVVIALTAAGATRVMGAPADPSSAVGAQTTAVQALSDNLRGMRQDLDKLTESVNRNADEAKNRDAEMTRRIDGLYEKRLP